MTEQLEEIQLAVSTDKVSEQGETRACDGSSSVRPEL